MNKTMKNKTMKTPAKTIAMTSLAVALYIIAAPKAQAVELWSNKTHAFEIVGDLHYGAFYHSVSINTPSAPDYDPVSIRGKSEIDFVYTGTINKDWEFGAKLEMRLSSYVARRDTNLTELEVDENYIYLKSKTYGELVLGSDKGAAGNSHVSAPEFLADDLNSIEGQDFRLFEAVHDEGRRGANGRPVRGSVRAYFYAKDETDLDYDEDVHKIIYYTPRLWGAQFGISYAPDLDDNTEKDRRPPAIVVDNQGNPIGTLRPPPPSTNTDIIAAGENNDGLQPRNDGVKDGVALSLTYQSKIFGLEMDASGGVLFAKRVGAAPDPFSWSVGAKVGMDVGKGKAKIGAGYLRGYDADAHDLDDNVFIVGIAYERDAWAAGIHYGWSKETRANSPVGKRTQEITHEVELGGHYRLSDYMAINAMVEYVQAKVEVRDGAPSQAEGVGVGMIWTVNF